MQLESGIRVCRYGCGKRERVSLDTIRRIGNAMPKVHFKIQLVAGKTRVCFFNDSYRTKKAAKRWIARQRRPSPDWQTVKVTEEIVG